MAIKFYADIDLNSNKITNLGSPTASSDAATKAYVDSVAQGLQAKQSVRAATTSVLTVASRTSTTLTISGNSLVIDGYTCGLNDRILVKNGTSHVTGGAKDNGIYVVSNIDQSSITLTRANDANTWDALVSAYVFVESGNDNGDTGWLCTINPSGDPNALGTLDIVWTQFTAAGDIQAGSGLIKNGNTISLAEISGYAVLGNAGSGTAVPSAISASTTGAVLQYSNNALHFALVDTVNIANSAVTSGKLASSSVTTEKIADEAVTNAKLAQMPASTIKGAVSAGAPQDLTSAQVRSVLGLGNLAALAVIGPSASSSSWAITHNFGTRHVLVQVYSVSSGETVYCDVSRPSNNVNQVVLSFSSEQPANSLAALLVCCD